MADPTGPTKSDNNQALKIILIVIAVVVGLGILSTVLFGLLAGKIVKEVAEEAGVEVTDDGVTLNQEDGDSSFSVGENAELPDDFPSDVPIYEPSSITYTLKTDDRNFNVTLASADDPTKIKDFYATELAKQGWETGEGTFEVTFEEGGFSRTYKKGNRSLVVSASVQDYEDSDEKTTINITVGESDS